MNCHEALAMLPAYSDGELDAVQSAAMEKHVLGCPDCGAQRDAFAALRARIRSEAPYYTAPASLQERVRAAIARGRFAPAAATPPVRERWRWLSAGALAGSAATVFAWFLGTAVLDWRVNADLDTEAVANHARATLAQRLTDVSSSDRHTVKPWLSSRLDYSPPVQDFAADGLPLVGGRLDYLGGQAVATLVYRYREHSIDVFVRPLSGGAAAATPSLTARRGFNVAHATGAGMEWWGVSDVSADVLAALVARLARGE
ncbi:MAG TPA: zf-HC2 domain-containing protein [Casimicrobiaceae bacterium]|nr:zf-HC2 domain-containing protein [Casimicrobiaceae bacterium]